MFPPGNARGKRNVSIFPPPFQIPNNRQGRVHFCPLLNRHPNRDGCSVLPLRRGRRLSPPWPPSPLLRQRCTACSFWRPPPQSTGPIFFRESMFHDPGIRQRFLHFGKRKLRHSTGEGKSGFKARDPPDDFLNDRNKQFYREAIILFIHANYAPFFLLVSPSGPSLRACCSALKPKAARERAGK